LSFFHNWVFLENCVPYTLDQVFWKVISFGALKWFVLESPDNIYILRFVFKEKYFFIRTLKLSSLKSEYNGMGNLTGDLIYIFRSTTQAPIGLVWNGLSEMRGKKKEKGRVDNW
jgi:hypothetical protein